MDTEHITNIKRQTKHIYQRLTCLVDGLVGFYTTVDLRNDSYVSGKIDQVDGFMNIVLSDVVFTDLNGSESYFGSFFVKERNIRYVHIPNEISILQTIEDKVNHKKKMKRKSERPLSLKANKLIVRQRETLAQVRQIKKERLKRKLELNKAVD